MKFRRLFLPTAENDYTPHLLQRAAMAMMLALILISFTAVNLQALFWQSSSWLVGTVLPAVVVDLTNSEREDIAAAPLRRSSVLDEAARLKAEHMAERGYFAHYSPDGVSPWYWFDVVSYTYAHAGENLAVHFSDSGAVVEAWMNSPTHKANIIDKKYTEIGVGTAKGIYDGHETVFVVQLFGTPAAPVPVEVVPELVVTPVAEPEVLAVDINDTAAPIEVAVAELTPEPPIVEVVEAPEPVAVPADTHVTRPAPDSLFSSYVATSSGLPPVSVGSVSGTTAESVSFSEVLITQPSATLQVVYLTIGLLVAVLLLVSIVIGINHTRPLQVVYGVGLLMLMSGLFYVHASLTAGAVIAAEPVAAIEVL